MEKKTIGMIALTLVCAAVVIAAAIGLGLFNSGQASKEKGTLQFGYVLWDGEIASTNVLTLVLEEAGYDVDMINVDAGVLYQSLADGDLDFTVSAWLPATQANYWDVYGQDIDSVATNLEGCKIGLVVPTYMTNVNNIYDLKNYSNELQSTIVGIDPGAGEMAHAQDAIDQYELGFELEASSSAGMLTSLSSAYDDNEPIVVTLWSPHWAFNQWDLKYLEDPLGVFGGAEHVQTLARKGFQADNPGAYEIIKRFNWTQDDIQSVMTDIHGGMDEQTAAQKWIDNNQAKVDAWING
jgi:glycine betaine/proline transport system substrate-binding protein